jgi:beta-barrel assembly-enhancing protease
LHAECIGCECSGQDFDGHSTVEPGVGRPIDGPHSAFAQLGAKFVVSKGCLWTHGSVRAWYHLDATAGRTPGNAVEPSCVWLTRRQMKYALAALAVPLLAQQGVNFYSLKKERALGKELAAEVKRRSEPIANPELNAYVNRVSNELVARLTDRPFDYHFEVISDSTTAEPVSLPGGFVLIPVRSFVIAATEAEFVGMLAHSIGHVALRHGTRTATRGQIVNLASIPLVFMGGWQGAHSDAQAQGVLVPVSYLKFQCSQESEADQFGIALAARAGFDPGAYQRFIERRQTKDSERSPLPPRERRLVAIRETISSLPSVNPLSSSAEFLRVQEVARAITDTPEQKPAPTLRRGRQL